MCTLFSKFTTSLLKMGFPLNWCLQALDECAKDREASSRWMLLHRAQLSANDHAVRFIIFLSYLHIVNRLQTHACSRESLTHGISCILVYSRA
jgi:hypothetical protein